jgi:hypothetical protein
MSNRSLDVTGVFLPFTHWLSDSSWRKRRFRSELVRGMDKRLVNNALVGLFSNAPTCWAWWPRCVR